MMVIKITLSEKVHELTILVDNITLLKYQIKQKRHPCIEITSENKVSCSTNQYKCDCSTHDKHGNM